jgi:hypothetical protein
LAVRLERANGGIRADVALSFNPVAGPAGTRWPASWGANPKQQLDRDLL